MNPHHRVADTAHPQKAPLDSTDDVPCRGELNLEQSFRST
jgi:hypothetical protein